MKCKYSPCNFLIAIMTKCPLLTLLFGIALPLYIGYLGAVASNYNIIVDIDFASYLQAKSHLQSIENAYLNLVDEQYVILNGTTDDFAINILQVRLISVSFAVLEMLLG